MSTQELTQQNNSHREPVRNADMSVQPDEQNLENIAENIAKKTPKHPSNCYRLFYTDERKECANVKTKSREEINRHWKNIKINNSDRYKNYVEKYRKNMEKYKKDMEKHTTNMEKYRKIFHKNLSKFFGGIYNVLEEDCDNKDDEYDELLSDEKSLYTKITQKILRLEKLTEDEAKYTCSDEAMILTKWKHDRASYCVEMTDYVPLLKLFINDDALIHGNHEFLFYEACKYGRLQSAKWLKEQNPSIDIFANFYCRGSAFAIACKHGHLPVVKWIMENYPYRPKQDKMWSGGNTNRSALSLACEYGHLAVAKLFQEKWPWIKNNTYYNKLGRQGAQVRQNFHIVAWLDEP